MHDAIVACVVGDGIAGGIAEDGQVVIQRALVGRSGGEPLIGIVAVKIQGDQELLEVIFAGSSPGSFFGAYEDREEQGGQDGNNSNHYQQLDQREG
jgi:hypothetical protein